VEQKLIGLLNDLAYYQSISADGFNDTVTKLSFTLNERDPQRAKILRDLGSVVQQWKR
jgi:hypothetical protein